MDFKFNDWLNRNSLRSYPLVDGPTPLLSTGEPLWDSLLVDASLFLAWPDGTVPAIGTVAFTRSTATVVIVDAQTGASICHATCARVPGASGSAVPVESSDGRAGGHLVFGPAMDPSGPPMDGILGAHQLSQPVPLEARCWICTGLPMVESLEVPFQNGPIQGDVELLAGEALSIAVSTEGSGPSIRSVATLSLKAPWNFLPACWPKSPHEACRCPGTAIGTINGVPGHPVTGNLDIVFGNGLEGVVDTDQGESLVSLLVEGSISSVCREDPVVPDRFGRLGPEFSNDCPPRTDYGLPDNGEDDRNGPPCRNPLPRIPGNCSH